MDGMPTLEKTIEFWDRVELGAALEYSKQLLSICTEGISLEGKSVLDAGCGTGAYTLLFCQKKSKVIGADISLKSLKIAKSKLEEENSGNAYLIQADINSIPLKESFDIIWSFGCLCYLKDVFYSLDNLLNLLNDKGVLIVSMEKRTNTALTVNIIRKWLYRLPHIIWLPVAKIIACTFLIRAIVFKKKERRFSNLVNIVMGQFWPIQKFVNEDEIREHFLSVNFKDFKTINLGRTFVFVVRKE